MIAFTLDTNCLIDVEQVREFAPATKALVDAHRSGRANVAIPAVIASERQPDGSYLDHFDRFLERLDEAGFGGLPLVNPIAVYGIGFWGRGYWADEAMQGLQNDIHAVLHPAIEPNLADFCSARGLALSDGTLPPKWRNGLCDVQIVWSHIHHGRDCLVTRDENFLKPAKLSALKKLGVGDILRPSDAAALLNSGA